ncbi:hypothetical protein ACLOJK_037337 [Asimina triloba]
MAEEEDSVEEETDHEARIGFISNKSNDHSTGICFMPVQDNDEVYIEPTAFELQKILELYANFKKMKTKYIEAKPELTNVKLESSKEINKLKKIIGINASELEQVKAENIALKKTLTEP